MNLTAVLVSAFVVTSEYYGKYLTVYIKIIIRTISTIFIWFYSMFKLKTHSTLRVSMNCLIAKILFEIMRNLLKKMFNFARIFENFNSIIYIYSWFFERFKDCNSTVKIEINENLHLYISVIFAFMVNVISLIGHCITWRKRYRNLMIFAEENEFQGLKFQALKLN